MHVENCSSSGGDSGSPRTSLSVLGKKLNNLARDIFENVYDLKSIGKNTFSVVFPTSTLAN